MKVMEIVHKIEEYREFHVREPLLPVGEINPQNHALRDLVLSAPGVEWVEIARYSITIRKARLYEWDEVIPKVTDIMNAFALPITSTPMEAK